MTKKPFSGNLTNHKIGTRAAPARGRASSILVAALVIFSTLAIPPLALAAPDDVHTYAGGGICATTGPALDTCIESPDGLAVDSLKNIYVAESATNRILKIDTDGNISRIAGNGTNGFCGDGGPAIAACLSSPSGLALDSSGNLYVADSGNNRVRLVNTSGTISTVAGTGSASFCGDGGAATSACLNGPLGLALDLSGNLHIADAKNDRVRKIDGSGNITTIAGSATQGFCGDGGAATSACLYAPSAVAFNPAGALFIADTQNNRVRRVTPAGTISTFAGKGTQSLCGDNGPATDACLNQPSGLAITGNVYIADAGNGSVRRVESNGNIVTIAGQSADRSTYCGDGLANAVCLSPRALALDVDLALYASDSKNHRIFNIETVESSGSNEFQREIRTVAGNGYVSYCGDGGSRLNACFRDIVDTAFDSAGNMYLSDSGNHLIRKISPSGTVSTVAGGGVRWELTTEVPLRQEARTFCGDQGPATSACLNFPQGVAVDSSGSNLYIADTGNRRVRKVNLTSGIITTVAGNGVSGWGGPAATGCPEGVAATGPCLTRPRGLVLDSSGNLFISDFGTTNSRIVRVSTAGTIFLVAGKGTAGFDSSDQGTNPAGGEFGALCPGDGGPARLACLGSPSGLRFDSLGNLLFVDASNNRVRKIVTGADGVVLGGTNPNPNDERISTLAGNGSSDYCGEEVPGTSACLKIRTSEGASLHPSASRSASGTGPIIDRGATTSQGNMPGSFQAVLRVTANNRSMFSDFIIQHSTNNIDWFDLNDPTRLTTSPDSTTHTPDNHRDFRVCGNTIEGPCPDNDPTSGNTNCTPLGGPRCIVIPETIRIEINRPVHRYVRVVWEMTGTGALTFSLGFERTGPAGLVLDPNNHVFFADTYNQRIRRVSDSGVITTIAGSGNTGLCGDGGASGSACFSNPLGMDFDSLGNMYTVDSGNQRIRQIENFTPWSYPVLTATKNGLGTITSNPAGIDCGSACWKVYVTGTNVTLSATPAAGYYFIGWSGACSGTGSCNVTMNQSKTVTATFGIPTLAVTRSGSGAGTVTSSPAGINCGTQCFSEFPAGTTITLVATPSNSTFTGWSGACSGTGNCVITLNSPTGVNASFSAHPMLTVTKSGTGLGTVTSDPAGINCPTQCGAHFVTGTEVELTATPGPNSTFEGWSGACSGTGSCVVTIDQSKTVGASFKAFPTLTVTKYFASTGLTGTVTSTPAGINCGTQCLASYPTGTTVTLTAVSGPNGYFAGWFGACSGTGDCVVTMDDVKSVTAAFNPNPTLTVLNRSLGSLAGGTGQGTVTSDPAGINCGTQCTTSVAVGSTVTLTATASAGSVFTGWSGAGCSGTGVCVVTVTQSRTVTATFHLVPFVTLCAVVQVPFVC